MERDETVYDSGACERFSWKQTAPGKPTQPPALMPHGCLASNSHVPHTNPGSFVLKLSKPNVVSHVLALAHLIFASHQQTLPRRKHERWNCLFGLHHRLGQLWSLIGEPLEFCLSLESHQEVEFSFRELMWLYFMGRRPWQIQDNSPGRLWNICDPCPFLEPDTCSCHFFCLFPEGNSLQSLPLHKCERLCVAEWPYKTVSLNQAVCERLF